MMGAQMKGFIMATITTVVAVLITSVLVFVIAGRYGTNPISVSSGLDIPQKQGTDLTLIAKTGFAAGYCYATLGEGDEKGAARRVGLSVADFRAYCNNSTNAYNMLTE